MFDASINLEKIFKYQYHIYNRRARSRPKRTSSATRIPMTTKFLTFVRDRYVHYTMYIVHVQMRRWLCSRIFPWLRLNILYGALSELLLSRGELVKSTGTGTPTNRRLSCFFLCCENGAKGCLLYKWWSLEKDTGTVCFKFFFPDNNSTSNLLFYLSLKNFPLILCYVNCVAELSPFFDDSGFWSYHYCGSGCSNKTKHKLIIT